MHKTTQTRVAGIITYEVHPYACFSLASTVQINGKVNVSHGRTAGHTWPDVSVPAGTGCPFRRQPAVTLACGHSTPACARAANRAHRFQVKQCSAASLTVAVDHAKSLDQTRLPKSSRLWVL